VRRELDHHAAQNALHRAGKLTSPLPLNSTRIFAPRALASSITHSAARAAIDQLSGRELSLKATAVYIKRAEEAVKSVRGKADVVTLSAEEQRRIGAVLRPIIDEWITESEGKGIPARDMLKRAGFSG